MNQAQHSIPAFIEERTGSFSGQAAFTCMGQTLSYAQVDTLSDQFAAWLVHDSGLQPADRVAVQLPNILQYPLVALAVFKARMVLVNINPLYTPLELLQQLKTSGARLLVVLANMVHSAARILPDTQVRKVVVTRIGDMHPLLQRLLLNPGTKYRMPAFTFASVIGLLPALRRGAKQLRMRGLWQTTIDSASLALLQFTGGTTGVAKAAMLTHDNLVSNILQLEQSFNGSYPAAGAVMVAPLPLYHVYAFTISFLSGMAQGHHTLLIPDPRNINAMVKALRPWRINGFVGINTLYRLLCSNPEFRRLDFSALQIASAGGMALSPQEAQDWEALTGRRILQGYGLSECSPLLACSTYSENRKGSVGKLVPATQLKLLDTQGKEAKPGEPGEICVKGPQVMQGYWQSPEATAQVFDAQGWFHTGDVGVLDDAGFLSIVDRIKDIIIVSGFKVYPNEVEDRACAHPDIVEACAVAVGDQYSVQIKLCVVSSNSELSAQEVIQWCRQGLAAYKVPRHIEFRSCLPKSAVGKILRKELRSEEHKGLGAVSVQA